MKKTIAFDTEKDGRCFQFTYEQVDYIIHALQMASVEYHKQFKKVCDNFPNEPKDQKEYWFNKSNIYYDLAEDLKNGNFDI